MKGITGMGTVALVVGLALPHAEARDTWTFEAMGGYAYSFDMPLTIHQDQEQDIDLTARYNTLSFDTPIYYALRVGRWREDRAWEIELIHLKIRLENTPPEVDWFEVSHGYNLVTVNRAWRLRYGILRVGLGVVVSHPENTVRGKKFPADDGLLASEYYLSGASAQVAVNRRFHLSERLFLGMEGKLTAAYAEIPIEDGDAEVPNVSAHVLLGMGVDF